MLEEQGRTIRPFLTTAGVIPRRCSLPLQRRIVDFGADVSFQDVPKKLFEHYGVEICPEVIRKVTLEHARKIEHLTNKTQGLTEHSPTARIIAEADGGMVPIVVVDNEVHDKRKSRKVLWKEARLCFSRGYKQVRAVFRATLKSTEAMGDLWFASALAAGMGPETEVHCIGDGAPWIKEQADRVFGGKNTYLVDFYHVSEYLAQVAHDYSHEPMKWLAEQQIHLKAGQLYLVLQTLEKYIYGNEPPKESVRECYRYLTNRLHQLDYLRAIIDDLPIGSGEIESGHRHVVQKRMKKSGSWWKEENAEHMLQLLTLRANGHWELYWASLLRHSLEEVA